MVMSWDDSLNTGIKSVDEQHMKLVETLENFICACEKNHADKDINKTLNFLEDYVVQHFKHEEDIQQEIGYPNYSIHKHAHEGFIEGFIELKADIDEEGVTDEIVHRLKDDLMKWVVNHVSTEDMRFGAYYRSLQNNEETT
jgi:hemerythrin